MILEKTRTAIEGKSEIVRSCIFREFFRSSAGYGAAPGRSSPTAVAKERKRPHRSTMVFESVGQELEACTAVLATARLSRTRVARRPSLVRNVKVEGPTPCDGPSEDGLGSGGMLPIDKEIGRQVAVGHNHSRPLFFAMGLLKVER